MILRQSTSQVVRFGPFLDSTDGVTAETALTIAQADMQLSKDGGAFAQKNASGNATHDTAGWYSTTLNATDTNTVGELILQVAESGALPVWHRWYVVEEAIYDKIYAASASFNDLSAADVNAQCDTAISDASLATAANLATVDTNVDAILVDTGTTIPAQIIALNNISVADILAGGDVDGFTLEETLKLVLASVAAKLSGAATTTITIRAADDSKDRITATVDANGNRSAVTLDATG